MVGGISITGNLLSLVFSRLFRPRCDALGFERSTIEIIAEPKVALTLEP
jgi:hypothetical protein